MTEGKEKLEYVGKITSIKRLEKVTLLNFEGDVPTISFFTRDYDGNTQFDWLEEGEEYKFIYYKNGQYYNLLDVLNPNGTKITEGYKTINKNQKKLQSSYKKEEADRQTKIIRQSAIKSAVDLVIAENQHDINNKDLTEQVIQKAEVFEKWVNR
jgi:hypothetical protein